MPSSAGTAWPPGVSIARNALVVDAAATFAFGRGAYLNIGYGGQIGDGASDHGAQAEVRVVF